MTEYLPGSSSCLITYPALFTRNANNALNAPYYAGNA